MELLSILGPTGTGKSTLAVILARELNAEIISCDSMMVYRGMNIGTAKPSLSEREKIKHHMIDIIEISEPYNAAQYTTGALACISKVNNCNKLSILCGGTGLYAKALLDNYHFLPKDEEIAGLVKNEYSQGLGKDLLAELATIDPETAKKVKSNPQRLIRAVEIIRITKRPLRDSLGSHHGPLFPGPHWILLPEAQSLRRRIERRTNVMLRNGWIEETKELVNRGLLNTPTACKALGYSQIADYLDGRIGSFAALCEKVCILTCQYAKRQKTWFRNKHSESIMVDLIDDWNETEIAERILNEIGRIK